jgi:hypothetical protein
MTDASTTIEAVAETIAQVRDQLSSFDDVTVNDDGSATLLWGSARVDVTVDVFDQDQDLGAVRQFDFVVDAVWQCRGFRRRAAVDVQAEAVGIAPAIRRIRCAALQMVGELRAQHRVPQQALGVLVDEEAVQRDACRQQQRVDRQPVQDAAAQAARAAHAGAPVSAGAASR